VLIDPAALVPCELSAATRGELRAAAVARAGFGVLGRRVTVRFDEAECAEAFGARYRDVQSPGLPAAEVIVARGAGGRTFFAVEGGEAFVWPEPPLGIGATAFVADVVATHALFSAIPGAFAFHAASLAYRGGAFAILGASEAGKSTTALACVEAGGCALFSDERCVVKDGVVHPFARGLNVRTGALGIFAGELPPSSGLRARIAARPPGEWRDARFDEVFGPDATAARPLPLRAIFAIAGRADAPAIRRVDAAMLLPAASSCAKRPAGLAGIAAILALLRGVACYELVLGSPCATARALTALLDRDAA